MPTNPNKTGSGNEGLNLSDILDDSFAWGMLAVDASGQIAALTPLAKDLLRPLGGLQHLSAGEALPAPVQSIVREVRKTGRAATDQRIVIEGDKGSEASLSVTAIPVLEGNQPGSIVVLLKNVASTVKLDQHVRRLNRLASIGTLSASMAHEIKNALVPVRTLVGLLLEQNPGAELAGTVNREMARVDAIVTRMLRFAGPAKPNFSDVRLHQLLEHCFGLVQHRAEGKRISFHRAFKAPSDALRGDDYQLEQAFLNLMLNAVESMGSEGTLTVGTEAVTGEDESISDNSRDAVPFLKVNISDTGAGIALKHLGLIFDAFFTTKQSGTGLGLAVTRRIIEEHAGVIRVHSRPGQGTTFSVLLPARPATEL